MRTFHIRDFANNAREDWPCRYNEKMTVVLDDGTDVIVTTARLEVSKYLWLIHERYDKLPITKDFIIPPPPLSNDIISKFQSKAVKLVYDIYGAGNYDREDVWRLVVKSSERLYNSVVANYGDYVSGLSAFDSDEIYNYPPIKELRDNCKKSMQSIANTLSKASEIFMADPGLSHNPIIRDLRAKNIKMEQFLQIYIVRGYTTRLDDATYTHPVMGCYYGGITNAAESMMESEQAAKALYYQGPPLKQAEYDNRRLQFVGQRVDLLFHTDCGSTTYGKIEVTRERLGGLTGLYFDTGNNVLKPLSITDTHLIGKTLSFRLPIYCRHRSYNGVCSICYGQMAESIPRGRNIGHIATTEVFAPVSQKQLKVKHSETLTIPKPISFSQGELEYFARGNFGNKIWINEKHKTSGAKLILRAAVKDRMINASKLQILSFNEMEDPDTPANYSRFKEVYFEFPPEGSKKPKKVRIQVCRGSKMANLTYEFLQWFLLNKPKVDPNKNYAIDLCDWDFSLPIFELPNKHRSLKDFNTEVQVFYRSKRGSDDADLGYLRELKNYQDPVEAMLDLYDLISEEVKVHMTHVAVSILGYMVSDVRLDDYSTPPLDETTRFATHDEIMNGGSFGALFAYQGGGTQMKLPQQYLNTRRPPHLLDPILKPH